MSRRDAGPNALLSSSTEQGEPSRHRRRQRSAWSRAHQRAFSTRPSHNYQTSGGWDVQFGPPEMVDVLCSIECWWCEFFCHGAVAISPQAQ